MLSLIELFDSSLDLLGGSIGSFSSSGSGGGLGFFVLDGLASLIESWRRGGQGMGKGHERKKNYEMFFF